ncbi:MAG: DUF4214 domain-containing protein [Herbiconiux sp.]|uniref:DUF4214 domain-containing protein n=1 Tax=Herbiconiux sp. TaxID=1871186 RepID=UPI00120E45E9|nr:DUF4214 domain-containing protein [Herbiconiux sp.]TAJ49308.1 MAG: DUF4214 domain-containing protein [Herbiconiux sp.]
MTSAHDDSAAPHRRTLTRRQVTAGAIGAAAMVGLVSAAGVEGAAAAPALSFVYPCDERRVSDDWAAHRARGSAGGTDYIAIYGSEVRAMANGTVTTADWTTSGSGGRYIRIDHGSMGPYRKVQTDSLHLSELYVQAGQTVTVGQVIARSGASGFGSDYGYGPHLHISGWFDGSNLDIEPYVSAMTVPDATSLVYALYQDILVRKPDEVGLASWRNALVKQGAPTMSVANGILYSDEYYLQRIDAAYREILNRDPDPIGRADWHRRMQTGTTSVDEIRMTFTRSLEYYLAAGGTDTAFIGVLYRTMLRRQATDSEIVNWVKIAAAQGTGTVVSMIWNSYESGTIRLNTVYNQFLKRDVDPSGVKSWVPLITGQGDQAARTAIVTSAEYLIRARERFPQN